MCASSEDLFLWGDFESVKARQFNIDFKKCTGEAYCKTDEEITDFLRGKYLLILTNAVWFDSSKYFEKSVQAEANLLWKRFNTQVAETIPFRVSRTEIELQDGYVDLDSITLISDGSVFELEEL